MKLLVETNGNDTPYRAQRLRIFRRQHSLNTDRPKNQSPVSGPICCHRASGQASVNRVARETVDMTINLTSIVAAGMTINMNGNVGINGVPVSLENNYGVL